MSLVAYDNSDSDEGSENEESERTINDANDDTDDGATEITTLHTSSKLSLPAPRMFSQSTKNDEEEESDDTGHLKYSLGALPKPADFNSATNIVEEDDDIPLKREMKSQPAKPAKKQTVKITVPSLSEFKDVEEESEKKSPRVVPPPEKGCGLLALLVPPSANTVNNKALIPQAVKNAAVRINIQQPKAARKSDPAGQLNDSKAGKSIVDKSHNELNSDDEEDDAAVDFFGLAASKNMTDGFVSGLLDTELSPVISTEETSPAKRTEGSATYDSPSDIPTNGQSSKTLTSNVMNLPKEEILLKNKAEVGPKLPVPEQEYNVDTEGNIAFDEKAIEYLCGRRGVKRKEKEIDEANIIEINGEDIKPDEREWLVKALTEEPVQRPVSMQSYGINSQSKKKHQITYLAHQAKAMELELKNQWSENRMTRKQTKSKYGF